jgi:hypothetical protein
LVGLGTTASVWALVGLVAQVAQEPKVVVARLQAVGITVAVLEAAAVAG